MPRLDVTIVGCSGLVSDGGPTNPYCTIQYEGKGHATDPCTDTTNPIWDRTFTLLNILSSSNQDGIEKHSPFPKAHVCVWNRTPAKDIFLGDYWLDIETLVRGNPNSLKVPLAKCKGHSELHMVVTAIDFGAEESSAVNSQQDEIANDNTADPTATNDENGVVPPAPRSMPPPTTTKGLPVPPTTGRVLIRSSTYGTNLQGHNGRVCTSINTRAYEVWNIGTLTEDGRYIFQCHDGGYLHADPNKRTVNTSPTCEDWEKWSIEPHPVVPGTFIIVSHHGTCLQAERGGGLLASAMLFGGGGISSSSQTVSLASKPEEGDMWEIISLAGSGVDVGGDVAGIKEVEGDGGGGYVTIRSFHNTYLHGHGGKVCTSPHEEATSRRTTWTIKPLGGGKYSLQTQDGTYLRADPKLFVNTASSCQDWEMWYVEAHPTIPTKAAIRSHHGTFLRADGGTVDLAVRPLEWEAWEVIPV